MAKGVVKDVVFARGVTHLAATINEIALRHRITPADLTRGLLEAACQFYREHGWFSFPILIEPLAFQAVKAAEDAGDYTAENLTSPADAIIHRAVKPHMAQTGASSGAAPIRTAGARAARHSKAKP